MTQPNLLVIVSDQFCLDAISAYRQYFHDPAWGCHWVETPNLDRMVAGGTSFLLNHSVNPVCSPARSAIFTGRMPLETGVTRNEIGIDRKVPNLAQWFESYSDLRSIYCGKWHAGGKWGNPQLEGPHRIPGFEAIPIMCYGDGQVQDYEISTSLAALMRNWREDQPFFAVAGLLNPHDICYYTRALSGDVTTPGEDVFGLGDRRPPLPPNYNYDFAEPAPNRYGGFSGEEQWRNYMYQYFRMVEWVDADVGRMLDAVDDRGGDTLVVFTSDHGEGCARHQRVQKWHPYDESTKVPMLYYWPGHIEAGLVDGTHLTCQLDIASTLCDYLDIPDVPHARGRSLRPLLEGRQPSQWRDNVCSEFQHTGRVIRTQRYKYVKRYEFSNKPDAPFVRASDGSATQFVQGHGEDYRVMPEHLLFDMVDDPWETRNLASEARYADVIADHEQLLADEWEARLIPGVHFDRN